MRDVDSDGFNISVTKRGGALNEPLSSAIDQAVSFWESALLDAPDVLFAEPNAVGCGESIRPEFETSFIDDMAIVVAAEDMDGRGGTLAAAGLCMHRGEGYGKQSRTPLFGVFVMDESDVEYLAGERDGILGVMIHEIGHLMGIGTTWYRKAPADGMTFDPPTRHFMAHIEPTFQHYGEEIAFLGANARKAWDESGGTKEAFSLNGTPIATTGGPGSFGGHWDETVMTTELMTPFHNGGVENPFSAISFQSMADIGGSSTPTSSLTSTRCQILREREQAQTSGGSTICRTTSSGSRASRSIGSVGSVRW